MTRYNLQNLYLAKIINRSPLNNHGSIKHTYQIVIDIKGSGMKFVPGDCLGVIPENDPEVVSLCIKHMKANESYKILVPSKLGPSKFDPNKIEPISIGPNENLSNKASANKHEGYHLIEYLTKKVNITKIKAPLLKILLKYASSEEIKNNLSKLLENKDELNSYLEKHELWDILKDFYSVNIPPEEICSALLPLLPRLYSISSAYCLCPNEIHLTVSYVEYETSNVKRHGVASHFLCKLAKNNIKIFIHPTHKFHLPEDPSTPIIMIATGAGIAPFISFIEHRHYHKNKGQNWLIFGECNKDYDYYYENYLEKLRGENFLEITTAFSRDQKEKIYVQHRLIENKNKIWEWINKGATVYVCGDARKMAVDIDKSLLTIFREAGSMDESASNNYLQKLLSEKRYLKDVY